MIKCKITKCKRCRARCSGTQREITKETALLIHSIYLSFRKKKPELASAYKNELIILLLDPDSPVWKTIETKEEKHEKDQ